MMKRTLFVIGIILIMLAVVAFPSCRSYPPTAPPPLSLSVPQRADLVAKIEIQQILNDADFASLYQQFAMRNPGMPRTVDQALDQVTDETGIDPRDFRQAVAFANTSEVAQFMESPYPGGPYWGALLKGSFAEERMMLAIAGLFGRELENYRYKGAKIYYYTEGREVLFSFTFVSNDLIVVGSSRAVEDTIDVMASDYEPISGIVYNLYESLPQAYFKAAFSIPPSITREIPSSQEIDHDLHLNLRPLRDVNIVGCTFDKIGSTIITEVQLHCTHTDSAQEIEELVCDLLGLGRLVAPDPKLKHHLDHIETTSYGSVFSLRITETTADIKDLIQSLTTSELPPPVPAPAPAPVLTAPELVTPYNGATGIEHTPTFVWEEVANAEGYELVIAHNYDFSDIYWSVSTKLTGYQFVEGLEPSSQYYWMVAAKLNPADPDTPIAWSPVWIFTTEG